MSPSSDDLSPYGAPSLEQLTGLVFELCSQLHGERVRRIALEAALQEAGLLAPDAVEQAVRTPDARARAAVGLDRAMAGVMRVVTEDPDVRTPLRGPADRTAGG